MALSHFTIERCLANVGVVRSQRDRLGAVLREPDVKPVGKPDAGIRHVRFDERGWETRRRLGASARAHPRLYLIAAPGVSAAVT